MPSSSSVAISSFGWTVPRAVAFAVDRGPPRSCTAYLARTALRTAERAGYSLDAARLMAETSNALASGSGLYGRGQRTGMLDRRGRCQPNWTIDPEHVEGHGHASLYQAWPCFMAHRPGQSWSALPNNSRSSEFDAGAIDWETLAVRALGGELDYYCPDSPAVPLSPHSVHSARQPGAPRATRA